MNDAEAAKEALERYQDNLKQQLENVANDETNYLAWDRLGDAYMDLDNVQEALNCFFKVIDLDPKNVQTLGKISMLYQGIGDLENAWKYANLNHSYQPEHYKPNYVIVGLLLEEGKYKEAKPYNEVCLNLYPEHSETNFRMATIYTGLGEHDKARECWENGTTRVYDSALSYCSRGQCYFKLGMRKEALADFKRAKEKIYEATSFTPSQKEYTRKSLKAVLEAEELSAQANDRLERLNEAEPNPALQEFSQRVQELREKQREIQDKVVSGIGRTDEETDNNMDELEKVRDELSKHLEEMNNADAAQRARERNEKELERQKQRVTQEEDSYLAWDNLGDAYMALDMTDEALKCFFKVIELDSRNVQTLGKISMLYQGLGDLKKAWEYANLNYSYQPEHYKPNYVIVGLLMEEGNFADAKSYNKVCLSLYPEHPETNFRMATIYTELGKPEKAQQCFKKGTQRVYNSALSYASRGQCYFKLGRREEALADFKQAALMIYDSSSFTPTQIEYTRKALKAVLEAEEMTAKANAELEKCEKAESNSNPVLKQFMQNLRDIQAQQKEVQDKLVTKIGKTDKEATQNMTELERLKEEFNKQLGQMKEAVIQTKNKTKKGDATHGENKMEKAKKELAKKLEEFEKKVNAKIDKQSLSQAEKTKLQKYFNGFVHTFSSAYVTTQVIGNGQVQLNNIAFSTKPLLSTLASFAPFAKSAFESKIKTFEELITNKEMIDCSQKIKRLASDTTRMSQLIGTVVYQLLINKGQQKRIINTTEQDVDEFDKLEPKMEAFCTNLGEKIDKRLYVDTYNTFAEKLAHTDANLLIEKWIKGEFNSYDMEKQFVQELMKQVKTQSSNAKREDAAADTSVETPTNPGKTITKGENSASTAPEQVRIEERTSDPEIPQRRCNCNMF